MYSFKKIPQNTAEKCIYKHARNLTKSRRGEAEETGLSIGWLDIISESQWNKASFLNI